MKIKTIILFLVFCYAITYAKIDLVTLPERDKVQLTIYNSADLTFVRESRTLTMKKGENKLQFSWANTLIDPTSLELLVLKDADKITVTDLVFPPRITGLGVWNIISKISGKVPCEINYFTSGISWQAYYLATLSQDEKTMKLEGYVKVSNRSGEDYENAQVRLIVGKINLLDEIANLAKRYPPHGRPEEPPIPKPVPMEATVSYDRVKELIKAAPAGRIIKQIEKEGLSEYFLYTIEGTETIPDGWTKRLLSFSQDKIPVINLYKYDESRFGKNVVRFLYFKNAKSHLLGKEPLPDGLIKVFKIADKNERLSYIGQDNTKYIPVDQEVELNLGPVKDIKIEPKKMNIKTLNYVFDGKGNITGWDEEQTWTVKVSNYRKIPAKIEITRTFPHQYWTIENKGDFGEYKQMDIRNVRYVMEVGPETTKQFTYKITLRWGTRQF
ncbi:MAG: DUF4139 domain-containing protein [Candidatus Omnitrophica bacterium]|nr:DUF4139 domain-containing protein [Candidatus Omnitrophota bacterium]MCM8816515.1 DUF4139 domain-containing protein [Candidatus Omnitrophota bacterium]